jgi:hypothetical protein
MVGRHLCESRSENGEACVGGFARWLALLIRAPRSAVRIPASRKRSCGLLAFWLLFDEGRGLKPTLLAG